MANILYAAFTDPALAEKAAGALLDHGVRAEDLSLVQNESCYSMPRSVNEDTGVSPVIEGEMTGATPYSPGVMGTGTYVAPVDGGYPMNSERDSIDTYSTGTVMESGTGMYNETNVQSGSMTTTGARSGGTGETMGMTTGSMDNEDDCEDPEKVEKSAKHGISTTTPADAGVGAIKGAAVGLGIGALAALASLLIPGVGLVVGGGALATALGGLLGATGAGAIAGAMTGYLKDQGVEEHVAEQYGQAIAQGGAILAVHVPSGDVDEPKARQLLEKYGATNVNTYAMAESARPYMA
ncbi:MAG: hypothetical protein QOJ65_798 [Fimbriimonadaceae bacterium]|jgi:hypothetical protein|nr:hypothetical protein [Fimbriimonadaceae bacterium]